jgi:hypothetical protein
MDSLLNRGWYPARVHLFNSGNGKGDAFLIFYFDYPFLAFFHRLALPSKGGLLRLVGDCQLFHSHAKPTRYCPKMIGQKLE